jgi:hypothetical protein
MGSLLRGSDGERRSSLNACPLSEFCGTCTERLEVFRETPPPDDGVVHLLSFVLGELLMDMGDDFPRVLRAAVAALLGDAEEEEEEEESRPWSCGGFVCCRGVEEEEEAAGEEDEAELCLDFEFPMAGGSGAAAGSGRGGGPDVLP